MESSSQLCHYMCFQHTSVHVFPPAACRVLSKLDLEHPEHDCNSAADASHGCITRSYAVLLQQAHGPDGSEEAEMSE